MRRLPRMPHSTVRRTHSWMPLAIAAFASLAPAVNTSAYAQQTSVPEVGVWLDDTQQGAVEIYICQDRADRLCGRIVWLRDPLNAEGKPKFDRYNPNAALQGRPICGLPVLGNLAKSSDGSFDNGWIYDPKAGKSYSAAIQLSSASTLTVTGYLGMKFMGKSFAWTRAPDNIQKCMVAAAPMKAPAAPAAPQSKPTTAALPAPGAGGAPAAGQGQKTQQPAAKPKVQATAGQPANGAKPASQPAAKAQAKTATSASPVLTAPPKPAKKAVTQEDADAGQ